MSVALPRPTHWARPSVPAPRSSLAASTEARAVHVRAAVEAIRHSFGDSDSVADTWAEILASRWCEEPCAASEAPALQAAWALVSMRIVGRSTGALAADATIRDAETWFLGSIRPPSLLSDFVAEFADRESVQALESILYDDDLRDLLPYVLDAHGPGSRASVMKDPGTQKSRRAKRAAGVFYTPSDVAEYIARETVREWGGDAERPHILDPACGSGVFLKAALNLAALQTPSLDRFAFVERSLFGIDINPLAVEAACFVLLHECLSDDRGSCDISPWSMWHRIRCNLCAADALTFQVAVPGEDRTAALGRLRATLEGSYVPPSSDRLDTEAATALFSRILVLGSVFPALTCGADSVIGNPPYATIGPRDDSVDLGQRFASLPVGSVSRSDYFPVFVEMMWRLARPGHSSSGMVVPLSLAYNSRAQMTATRRGIMGSGGRWRFAFFDREPHALFGEEVKTRNTIVLRSESVETSSAAAIETGALRKWTSRQRAQLFDTIDFTPLGCISIAAGIPKLAGEEPATVFAQLTRQAASLREMCAAASSCLPEEATSDRHTERVFVGGTAYNFLNVFRVHCSLPTQRAPWSSSKLHALDFASEAEASRAFAILSSRIVYWLWHVGEDGFHVTHSFVRSLPFGDGLFDDAQREALTTLGARMWTEVQAQQIISVNGGRQTVAYRPHASEDVRDEIDTLLLGALDVPPAFIEYLRAFTRSVVAVDENDETRRRFTNHFPEGGRQCPE